MVRGRKNPLFIGLPGRVRKARKTAGLTRKAVVQRIGGDQSLVRQIEEGQRVPTVGTITRLAAALGVTASWLGYGIGEPNGEVAVASCEGMGLRIQMVRVQLGYTKAALARLAGLSPSAFAKIENGGQSGVDVIEAIAQVIGVSPAWLAYGFAPQVLTPIRRGRPPLQSSAPDR